MICDARPVLRLSEDGTDLVERQVAEDPKFENFPVRLFHGMQGSVDPEGRIPVRYFLLDVGIIGGKDFRYRLGFFPAALLIQEAVFRDGAEPGDFV